MSKIATSYDLLSRNPLESLYYSLEDLWHAGSLLCTSYGLPTLVFPSGMFLPRVSETHHLLVLQGTT